MKVTNYKFFIILVVLAYLFNGCKLFKANNKKIHTYKIARQQIDSGCIIECAVYDKEKKYPLEDAIIIVDGTNIHGSTNKDGILKLYINPGIYRLKIIYGSSNFKTSNMYIKYREKILISSYFYLLKE